MEESRNVNRNEYGTPGGSVNQPILVTPLPDFDQLKISGTPAPTPPAIPRGATITQEDAFSSFKTSMMLELVAIRQEMQNIMTGKAPSQKKTRGKQRL